MNIKQIERRPMVLNSHPLVASILVYEWVSTHVIDREEFDALRLLIDAKPEQSECEQCGGKRGGVPGNENIIDGMILCDYCTDDHP